MITSPHNPKLKLIHALAGRSRERRENGAFLAEGVRLVEDALAAGWPFRFALAAETPGGRAAKLIARLEANGVDVERVQNDILAGAGETETSQGVLAVLELPSALASPEARFPVFAAPNASIPAFVVLFDQIRDPGNLGTLIRAAAAAGAHEILLPPETADAFAPKTVRAGMGAHFRLPILSRAWGKIRTRLNGLTVYLAETEQAAPCWQADFRRPLALIIGGEADGASAEARALTSQNVVIPMPGGVESLNAAMAGTVLMFEVVRQREERHP
ncbi:MAG: RNA methyltransferase [Anaerolineae bacterium CG_4_9_14_3_um_filter_57_17]|nr:RNA methyltransferase [bacterium]NCT21024.1 RNA methyltransferase [bacterium]OIO83309.1 MAG: hypothetical protein AUK01_12775 [Anaerolineae bacterium CG2_30_57_67]PJB67847.1 MAG: RNA methyltransferase [Anaerolineae bacterium CG_4_9_14_3_um_filter_57_17]